MFIDRMVSAWNDREADFAGEIPDGQPAVERMDDLALGAVVGGTGTIITITIGSLFCTFPNPTSQTFVCHTPKTKNGGGEAYCCSGSWA